MLSGRQGATRDRATVRHDTAGTVPGHWVLSADRSRWKHAGCGGESGVDMSGVGGAGSAPVRARLPQSSGGWWAVGLSAVGLGSWVVLPVLTVTLRDTYPVTDTWVMPAIGSVLIGVAAVVDVLCFVRRWDRSMLNVVAAAVTVPAALLAIAMVVGEGLAGV